MFYYFSDPSTITNTLEPILKDDLPKCKHCNHLLRPHIVWFGENLDPKIMDKSSKLWWHNVLSYKKRNSAFQAFFHQLHLLLELFASTLSFPSKQWKIFKLIVIQIVLIVVFKLVWSTTSKCIRLLYSSAVYTYRLIQIKCAPMLTLLILNIRKICRTSSTFYTHWETRIKNWAWRCGWRFE